MASKIRLGLFIMFTFAILATGVFLIGNKEMMFRSTYHLKANFETVSGLVEGASVRVGGLHKGTVDSIRLPNQSDQQVQVVVNLDRSTRNLVKKDSVALIRSEGLLGDKYVEVSFGTANGEPVRDGDLIQSRPPLDIADVVNKANALLDTTQEAMDNVKGATDSLQEITGKINSGQGSVGMMINDKSLYQKATAGMTSFAEDMEALKHNFFLRGFFRSRGYESSADLRKHQVASLPAGTPVKTFTFEAVKLFNKPEERARLKNEKMLKEAGAYLEQNPYSLVVVQAATGLKGEKEKNEELSLAQAMVVRDYLAKNFRVDDSKIKTMGLGESREASPQLQILVYPAKGTATASSGRKSN